MRGTLLILVGVLTVTQVLKGEALERLGLLS